MTTIAATRHAMAADSRVVTDTDTHYRTAKILRVPDAIAGAAGSGEWPNRFLEWCAEGRPKRAPSLHGADFAGLYLCARGLYVYLDSWKAERVKTPFWSIGSGAKAALAVLYDQVHRGARLDPRHAVKIACLVDVYSGPPVDYLRLKR